MKSTKAKIGAPPARVSALRTVLAELPGKVRHQLRVSADLSFVTDAAMFETFRIEIREARRFWQ
jgi:hypothetical protein